MNVELCGKLIECSVGLTKPFIGLSSTLVLNDLLEIEIERIASKVTSSLLSLEANDFVLKVHETKWLHANEIQIMKHLENNLFSGTRPRNLVLHGLKGSGKTTMIKNICNKVLARGAAYYLIDCRKFMSKAVDTIFEQLKLVYNECRWHGPSVGSLVVLENLDMLIENKTHAVDPMSQLYHAQIVECKF